MGCIASKEAPEEGVTPRRQPPDATASKDREVDSLPHGQGQKRRGSFDRPHDSFSDLHAPQTEQGERFMGVHAGTPLLCLDTFTSKYTKEVMRKWRPATVRVYDGSNKTTKALIHFDGWKEKFDKWVDLAASETAETLEIAPFGLLSAAQIEVGATPSALQHRSALDFLRHGAYEATEGMEAETATAEKSTIYRKDMIVDVLDVFSRSGQGQHVSFNWRKACVMEVAGSKLRVGYVGLGSEYDEIIDLQKEKGRLRDPGTMRDIQKGSAKGRQQRRSFDGPPQPTSPSRQSRKTSKFRSFDGKSFQQAFAQELQESSEYGQGQESVDSELDSPIDPAALLANREAHTRPKPQPTPPKKRRQISFTGRGGQVLPGAAVGYSPERHDVSRRHSTSAVESGRRESTEVAFEERLEKIGLHLVEVEADGNCLFRALAHQSFCDEGKHKELRAECVRHLLEHRNRFEIFCTSDFDAYCRRMEKDGTWAGELEIRAMEEVLDRVVLIYSSESRAAKPVPMNTSFDEQLLVGLEIEPIKLSYHYGCHYNSIYDQKYGFPLERRASRVLQAARLKLISSGNE